MSTSAITITDMFCGAGGSSTGAVQAGAEVRVAVNHWKRAIETHNTNHPNALHVLTDLSNADPRRFPKTTILIASPECTNHSLAKGVAKRNQYMQELPGMDWQGYDPAAERSRCLMWTPLVFAERHHYYVEYGYSFKRLRREEIHLSHILWERYPSAATHSQVRKWLSIQQNLGLAPNTIEAYARALEDYLVFSQSQGIEIDHATREHIAAYIHNLATRPHKRGGNIIHLDSHAGLSNATMQQRITAVRLYYDYLLEENQLAINPVGRGKYTPGKGFGGQRDRALLPRYHKLPWIPNEEQWEAILDTTKQESLRNRFMFALAYDAALRREELCSLEVGDIDPAHRLLRIRAETTKNRQARSVPYSLTTNQLFVDYLKDRRALSQERGPLFRSESRRNRARPISIWSWSKIVEGIAKRSGVLQLTTHTLRHLCLTDLAHAGWDIHEIAQFAGHRSTQTTLVYIHLSGRDLAEKLEKSLHSLHAQRMQKIEEVLK